MFFKQQINELKIETIIKNTYNIENIYIFLCKVKI